ncbi:MAG: nickel-dependent hydrogenase large subunit [Anaerosomatales bacterium]|nr:nickel-dependent hydrogenase large subunit [Anaerosomatales bacterium]
MARSIIDPVTRIEGHLRVEMEVDGGVVKDAWVSGTLFRGMELILQGRAPEDAFWVSQRICGVCPVSHGLTSTQATEAALGVSIPQGARLARNIVEGAQFLHSHILWFYNLAALDWVNPVNALKADIADTYALAEAAGTRVSDFGAVQKRLKDFVERGQLSIFSGHWFDSPEYKLPPELDLIATAHYLEALEMQAVASTISGIVGGKMPHIMTMVPGGTTWVPTSQNLDDVLFRFVQLRDWIATAMIPDTLAVAPYYLDALNYGAGVGNFLAWGVFDDESFEPTKRYLPEGIARGLSLEEVDRKKIVEYVDHSFYKPTSGGLHPLDGRTEPIAPEYDVNNKYTWAKAPRYDEAPMEVGGLSRLIVAYLRGVPRVKELIDGTLKKLGAPGKPEVLVSTLGRTAGRNLEALYVAELMVAQATELIERIKAGDAELYTPYEVKDGAGMGMWEAPRGALLHATNIKDGKIANYQCIVPSTWNISPRDGKGVRGPMEEALIGVPVEDLKKPILALRTVHSFDPCIACGVHVIDAKSGERFETVVTPHGMGVM